MVGVKKMNSNPRNRVSVASTKQSPIAPILLLVCLAACSSMKEHDEKRERVFAELDRTAQELSLGHTVKLNSRDFVAQSNGIIFASSVYEFYDAESGITSRMKITLSGTEEDGWSVAFKPTE